MTEQEFRDKLRKISLDPEISCREEEYDQAVNAVVREFIEAQARRNTN